MPYRLILGNQAFDPDIEIAGVILNQLGGSRHEAKLRAVIEHYTDVPVVGGVHRDGSLEIVERHLGLVPSNEESAALYRLRHIRDAIRNQVDLDRLLALAGQTPLVFDPAAEPPQPAGAPVRIGIARDAAFVIKIELVAEVFFRRVPRRLVYFSFKHVGVGCFHLDIHAVAVPGRRELVGIDREVPDLFTGVRFHGHRMRATAKPVA